MSIPKIAFRSARIEDKVVWTCNTVGRAEIASFAVLVAEEANVAGKTVLDDFFEEVAGLAVNAVGERTRAASFGTGCAVWGWDCDLEVEGVFAC